jgi:quercetin dioxygenase-like cupin family protein
MNIFALALPAIAALALAGCDRARDNSPTENGQAEAGEGSPPVFRAADDATLQWTACPAPLPSGCELAVLHGDPAKPNADALLRMPAGAAIPPHTHTSAERMILVSGRLDVRYQGAHSATLNPGNYAYGPANVPHAATCMAAEPCVLFIAFERPVDVQPYDGAIQ